VHVRSATAALLVAGALVVAPLTAASAADSGTGVTAAQTAKAKATLHRLTHKANAHRSFVLGGKVTAASVAATPDVASSLTFVVHGGAYKALRGVEVTVDVPATAKVTRDGVVELAAVQVGDHVTVRSHDFQFALETVAATTDAPASVHVTVTATVVRVAASAPETDTSVAPEVEAPAA
jgi:hypothetical protein